MRAHLTRRRENERGVVAVMVAVLTVALIVMAAFAVDFGLAYTKKRELQNGADAASLAAAQYFMENMTGECDSSKIASLLSDAEAEADNYMDANVAGADTSGTNLTSRMLRAGRCGRRGASVLRRERHHADGIWFLGNRIKRDHYREGSGSLVRRFT